MQIYNFSSFLADFNWLFLSKLCENFLLTINKCTVTIMIIITINIRSFLERQFLWDFY